MRKIWAETWKDFSILSRDRNAFLLLLVMPAVIIFILGSVFGSMWGAAPEKTPVVIVDMDEGELARILKDEVLAKPPVSDIVNVDYATTMEEGRKEVEKGTYAGCLVIPEGFSNSVLKGEKARLNLIIDMGRPIGATIIKEVAQRFTQKISQVQIGVSVILETFSSRGLIEPAAIPGFAGKVVGLFQSAGEERLVGTETRYASKMGIAGSEAQGTDGVSDSAGTKKEAVVKAMDYYAMGMGIMYALFTAMTTSGSIIEEKTQKTWNRMLVTATKGWQLLAGKLLYMVLAGTLQLSVLALFSKYVFGVNWGHSVLGFGLVTLGVVTATGGLLLTMASMASSAEGQAAIAVPTTMLLSFLGGAMWPVYIMPKWFDAVSQISPVRWGLRAFINLSQGATLQELLPQLLFLFGFGAIFLGLGAVMLSRKMSSRGIQA